jgi:DNA polymerase III subunit gamma/tau
VSQKALYTKYRSANLSEIVGQQHIVEVLKNAVKSDKISHAYLFTGPHGIGKTSIARIFAHQINGIEYDQAKTNLDIIEIDAASNSGVDDMRDLREKITSAPVGLKFKVYIIDEVHMLSPASFAALLKTIEEPPSHAVFILATTDAHKVPVTIMSRVQKFFFKPIDSRLITNHLSEICKKEKIKINQDALDLIAENSAGSMRDALSLLDQIASGNKQVDLKAVQSSLGFGASSDLLKLKDAILSGSQQLVQSELKNIISNGADPRSLALQVYQALKLSLTTLQELEVLGELLTLGSLSKPLLGLELTLLKLSSLQKNSLVKAPIAATVEPMSNHEDILIKPTKDLKIEAPKEIQKKSPPKTKLQETQKIETEVEMEPSKPEQNLEPEQESESESESDSNLTELTSANFSENWQEVLHFLAKNNPSFRSILKASKPRLTMKTYSLEICAPFPAHLKTLQEAKCKQALLVAFNQSGLKKPQLKFKLADKPAQKKRSPQQAEDGGDISAIMDLMGGGEAVLI